MAVLQWLIYLVIFLDIVFSIFAIIILADIRYNNKPTTKMDYKNINRHTPVKKKLKNENPLSN